MLLQYLLIRPHPSMRVLFTSPSLRVPGILQSPFLNRIGGSDRIRNELTQAFAEGRGVTAKIRWLTRPRRDDDTGSSNGHNYGEEEGRTRWIHCTPLLGHTGSAGVWMVVLVDEEGGNVVHKDGRGKLRAAPPVAANASIRRSQDERMSERERQEQRQYLARQQQQQQQQRASTPQNQMAGVRTPTTTTHISSRPQSGSSAYTANLNPLRSNPQDTPSSSYTLADKRRGVHVSDFSTANITNNNSNISSSRKNSYISNTTSVRPVSRTSTHKNPHSSGAGLGLAGVSASPSPAPGFSPRDLQRTPDPGSVYGHMNGRKTIGEDDRASRGSTTSFALRSWGVMGAME